MDKKTYYRSIPKVDVLMEYDEIKFLEEKCSREYILESVRKLTDELREFISNSESGEEINNKIKNLVPDIVEEVKGYTEYNLKKVVNGTGTILHTNLGRALISDAAADRIRQLVTGYSNLEYNLKDGIRGSRYSHFENAVTKITGAEVAMAVNNNAAAVLLILSALCKGKEVIVSRGELVEIGGSFRVPEVMEQSGCVLKEVGTTNKTHLYDYENAITEDTAALLKVHTSNYKIVGFTESVSVDELAELGRKYNIPVIEDIGSGVLVDLGRYGLTYEPTVQASVKAGADVVCFSGDKLLGGPQAGIIVGKKELLEKIKKHPLTRALRIDKFTSCALESVFLDYMDEERAMSNIPVLKLINKSKEELVNTANELCGSLTKILGSKCRVIVEDCQSQIGGGSLPLERIDSVSLGFIPLDITTASLENKLRHLKTPVVGRVVNDRLIIDLRTVLRGEEELILEAFKCIFEEER